MTKRILLAAVAAAMTTAPAFADGAEGMSVDALVRCSGLNEALSEWAPTTEEFETYYHFGGGFKNAAYEASPGMERSDKSRVQRAIDSNRNMFLADIAQGVDPIANYAADHEKCALYALALGLNSPHSPSDREALTVR